METGKSAEQLYSLIADELGKDAAVSQSKMFGSQGFKIAGKVFAVLVKGKLVLKLPKETVGQFIATEKGEHFDPGHGKIMKEWVALKPISPDEWLALAKHAKDFVLSGVK